VFFSMGYLVGRNTSATPTVDTASRPSKPIVIDNPSRASSGETPAATETTPSSSPAASPAVEPINPAAEAAKPERSRRAEAPAPTPPKHETSPVETPAGKPSLEEPHSGQTFLQVVATTRPDADLIAETLAKKGFHTTVVPGPNPQLFRVLVGPTKDTADLAETRVRVEAAGFKNPIVRKIP
jgi:cell division protein FtsN